MSPRRFESRLSRVEQMLRQQGNRYAVTLSKEERLTLACNVLEEIAGEGCSRSDPDSVLQQVANLPELDRVAVRSLAVGLWRFGQVPGDLDVEACLSQYLEDGRQ